MAAAKVRLKLLIGTKGHKVLFAEAGKDFVDFLFYIFSLPIGTVVKLLQQKSMAGCLSNLYKSIENLSDNYIEQNHSKKSMLQTISPAHITQIPLLLSEHESNTRKFYTCNNRNSVHYYVADVPNVRCPQCSSNMIRELVYVSPSTSNANEGGFVKGVVTYMVMDNLEVSPMSCISSITLLNKFKVKDVGLLGERVVDLGFDEGLKLLKASLECKTVLTSVFLGN